MLSLEQIKRLESRVYKAVELLKAMKEDNNILKSELKSANERVEELEQIISDYRNNQLEIEQGIVKAIQQLDDLDSIDEPGEESVQSAFISQETEPPAVAENSSETVQDTESQKEYTEDISSTAAEETADVISDSNESSLTEDQETIPEESSQQLDIF